MSNKHDIWDTMQQYRATKSKALAVLIDPDKTTDNDLDMLVPMLHTAKVDLLFIGGSLLTKDRMQSCVAYLKARTDIPLVLFPGSPMQVVPEADALLLLSLISGRNPELLIGQHVAAAPYLKESKLELIPTGYILVDGGKATTVSYISNTTPIPNDKPEIAACTALAGSMLGLRTVYLDAGSGAEKNVTADMIKAVRAQVDTPLIVGGGIRTPEAAKAACLAGADVVVVGNAIEKDPLLITDMARAVHSLSSKTSRV